MTPTPTINPQTRGANGEGHRLRETPGFPATDYQFHTALKRVVGVSANLEKRLSEARSFRRSSNQFGTEGRLEYLTEFLVFIGMTAVSVGALLVTVISVTRMVRGW